MVEIGDDAGIAVIGTGHEREKDGDDHRIQGICEQHMLPVPRGDSFHDSHTVQRIACGDPTHIGRPDDSLRCGVSGGVRFVGGNPLGFPPPVGYSGTENGTASWDAGCINERECMTLLAEYYVPGLHIEDRSAKVPLDWAGHEPGRGFDGESISLFYRVVTAPEHVHDDLPLLVFLQGGPGGPDPGC